MDKLSDTFYKNLNSENREYLAQLLKELLERKTWPKYLCQAKFIALSKTSSNYPKVEDTRTIALLNTLYKLIELIVLEQVIKEIEEKEILHKS